MNKDIFKNAVDEITVNQALIDKTIEKIEKEITSKKVVLLKRYIPVGALALIVMLGIFSYYKSPLFKQDWRVSKTIDEPIKSASDRTLPQIKSEYEAFDGIHNSIDNYRPPQGTSSYQKLKQESSEIILCTIEDIGVYQKKTEQYKLTEPFATYIYTAKIDKVLRGNMKEQVNDLIPIAEKAWAGPTLNDKNKIVKWNFAPYTSRPIDNKTLNIGKKYVIFLSDKDETDCYQLSFDGFGVFPLDYITKVSENYSEEEKRKKYNNSGETSIDFYITDCLHIKDEFLK